MTHVSKYACGVGQIQHATKQPTTGLVLRQTVSRALVRKNLGFGLFSNFFKTDMLVGNVLYDISSRSKAKRGIAEFLALHIEPENQHPSFIHVQLGNCDIWEVVQIRRLRLSVKAVANDLQANGVSPTAISGHS